MITAARFATNTVDAPRDAPDFARTGSGLHAGPAARIRARHDRPLTGSDAGSTPISTTTPRPATGGLTPRRGAVRCTRPAIDVIIGRGRVGRLAAPGPILTRTAARAAAGPSTGGRTSQDRRSSRYSAFRLTREAPAFGSPPLRLMPRHDSPHRRATGNVRLGGNVEPRPDSSQQGSGRAEYRRAAPRARGEEQRGTTVAPTEPPGAAGAVIQRAPRGRVSPGFRHAAAAGARAGSSGTQHAAPPGRFAQPASPAARERTGAVQRHARPASLGTHSGGLTRHARATPTAPITARVAFCTPGNGARFAGARSMPNWPRYLLPPGTGSGEFGDAGSGRARGSFGLDRR